jgi:GTPase SAR1 family protein
VYDISDPKSLGAIDRWKSELQDQGDPDLLMMLVGNKSDLEGKRKVSRTEGVQYAGRHGMLFEETSAKTGSNVQKAFTDLLTSEWLFMQNYDMRLTVCIRSYIPPQASRWRFWVTFGHRQCWRI